MNSLYNASPNPFEFQAALHQYIILTRIVSGPGCVKEIGFHAKKLKASKALIVTDPVIEKLGLTAPVEESLRAQGISFEKFTQVEENPSWQTIDAGEKIIKTEKCDLVIAIGGGSSIDAAKSMAMMGNNEGSVLDWEGIDRFPNDPVPLMVVPTTCGTGSEVTRGSMITDTARSFKFNVGSDRMRSKVSFLDPLMLAGIPASIAAATGVDALTHAIEGYVSNIATPLTDALLIGAIRLVSDNLRAVVANPKDVTATLNMQYAATIAGMGFNNAQLGIVHAMSEPLSPIGGVPHGVANAILLPHCMEFNLIGRIEKFAQIAAAMGEKVDHLPLHIAAEKSVQAVQKLVQDVGIPPRLSEVGVRAEHIPPMVEQARVHGLLNFNPRRANAREIEALYQKAF